MATKLHYFDSNGLAKSIRYMLHYGKKKFEDIRYDNKIWSVEDVKKNEVKLGYTPSYAVTAICINRTDKVFIIYSIVVLEMAKKLHYFDTIGIAESIRYMLHYCNQKFEDVRYDYKTWPNEDFKKNLPYGQLPFYEEGNKSLYQSIAIARYIAATNNLLPSDPWDQAQLDAVVLSVYDFAAKVTVVLKEQDPVKKETLKKVFDEAVEFYFSRFDDQLKNNQGFLGGTLSWADFVFIGFLEAVNLHSNKQIEGNYPHVATLMETIKTLPGVTEYISTRTSNVF